MRIIIFGQSAQLIEINGRPLLLGATTLVTPRELMMGVDYKHYCVQLLTALCDPDLVITDVYLVLIEYDVGLQLIVNTARTC